MRCGVPCCTNDSKNTIEDSNGLTFHRFPKDPNLRKSWMKALDIIDWEPDECSAVCSEHFPKDAFYETKCGTRRVQGDAVPVSDIEIMSVLKIKRELNEEEIKVDTDSIVIKQEILDDTEIAESSKSSKAVAQLNENMNTKLHKIVIKQELNEEQTPLLVNIKQELPIEYKSNCYEAASNNTEITCGNDSLDYYDKASEESLVTSKCKEDKPGKAHQSLREYRSCTESVVGDKSLICKFCDYRCTIKSNLLAHISKHRQEMPFACELCDFRCNEKASLTIHIRTHTGEKPFACQLCDYRCITKGKLTIHMRIHTGEKPFACQLCDYRCNEKKSVTIHMRTHTGEKPFACQQCDYKCKTMGSLTAHTMSHTGEKPFACQLCDYRSKEKRSVTIHMRTHTGEKPFACRLCDYRCKIKGSLTAHMRTHTGEKPFACQLCDYKSIRKTDLNSHMRQHTGEKPFACPQCDYRCVQKVNLTAHIRTHTGKKPFVCQLCDYKCTKKASFKAHMGLHTDDKH